MSSDIKSAGEQGGARCSGSHSSAAPHASVLLDCLPLGSNVLLHPTFGRPPVVNRRWTGRKNGVVSLSPCMREEVYHPLGLIAVCKAHDVTAREVVRARSLVSVRFDFHEDFDLVDLAGVARELVIDVRQRRPGVTCIVVLRVAAALAVLMNWPQGGQHHVEPSSLALPVEQAVEAIAERLDSLEDDGRRERAAAALATLARAPDSQRARLAVLGALQGGQGDKAKLAETFAMAAAVYDDLWRGPLRTDVVRAVLLGRRGQAS